MVLLIQTVPHIQSVSVTVDFYWEPSHEFKNSSGEVDDWMFEMQIGTMVDGKMVRRVVTEILDFYESSFVWLGADPFAKAIDADGNLVNIERAAIVGADEFEKDPLVDMYKSQSQYYVLNNCINDKNILSLSRTMFSKVTKTENFNRTSIQKTGNMNELIEYLAKQTGVKEGDEVTLDHLKKFAIISSEKLGEIKTNSENYEKLGENPVSQSQHQEVVSKRDELQGQVDQYKEIVEPEKIEEVSAEVELSNIVRFAKFGKQTLTAKKELCVKHYKLFVGEDNAEDSVIDMINNSDESQIDGLMKQYGAETLLNYGAYCVECGSKEVKFGTAKNTDEGDNEEGSPVVHMADAIRTGLFEK